MENAQRNVDSRNSEETQQQSASLISKDGLWSRFRRGREVRSKFVESTLNKCLALQIRAMRDQEGWSQQELAQYVGMNQNAISRLENPRYGKATLTTLKRLARVFDVAILIQFVPFSRFSFWWTGTRFEDHGLNDSFYSIPSFSDEERALGPMQENDQIKSRRNPYDAGSIEKPGPQRGSAENELMLTAAGQ